MGRKPKYDKPMSATERSRLRRERLKEQGSKVLHFSLDGEIVEQVDELVEFFELSGRAQVMSDLLKRPLYEGLKMMNDWKSNPDIPVEGDESGLDEAVSYAKRMMWNSLCSKNDHQGKN